MNKYLLILIALFVVAVPVLSFAQTEKELEQAREWLGTWKRNFASPTYGIAFFPGGKLEGGWYGHPNAIPDDKREFSVTAMDFRIFRGVNVSKRGGFYTGVEAGVLFLSPFADVTFIEPTIGEMHLEYYGGLVFLMAKYGLRMDIGLAIFGVSLGLEMGMGGTLFAGGFEFYTGSRDEKDISYGWGTSQASMGLIMDVAAEAALRLGKNLRLIAKAGFMAAPMSVPESRGWEEYNVWYEDNSTHVYRAWETSSEISIYENQYDYIRGVMSQYEVEIEPFCIDLRVGFALNFEI